MRFTIKAKIIAGFTAMIVLIGAAAWTGISMTASMSDGLQRLVDTHARQSFLAKTILERAQAVRWNMMVYLDDGRAARQPDAATKALADIKALSRKIEDLQAQLAEVAIEPQQKALDGFSKNWSAFLQAEEALREPALARSASVAQQILLGDGAVAFAALSVELEETSRAAGDLIARSGGSAVRARLPRTLEVVQADLRALRRLEEQLSAPTLGRVPSDLIDQTTQLRKAVEAGIAAANKTVKDAFSRQEIDQLSPKLGRIQEAWTSYGAHNKQLLELIVRDDRSRAIELLDGAEASFAAALRDMQT
ncbi:MAG: MCP four helix bundle domain-containing protein, partial [Pseudomonadota bacterium]